MSQEKGAKKRLNKEARFACLKTKHSDCEFIHELRQNRTQAPNENFLSNHLCRCILYM